MKIESPKVFHIIPSDSLGGVETAAIRAEADLKLLMNFDLIVISPESCGWFKTLIHLFQKILLVFKEHNPTIVTSLWKSHVLGFCLSVFKSDLRWIPFYHSSTHFGKMDTFFSKLSLRCCNNAFVDSRQTGLFIRSFAPKLNLHVIPYVFDVEAYDQTLNKTIDFIWVGRDDQNKNLLGFVKFCEYMQSINAKVNIVVVSSNNIDPGLLKSLSNIDSLAIYTHLTWEETQKHILNAKLMVCTSFKEGFSMVSHEALGLGCLPCGNLVSEVHKIIAGKVPQFNSFSSNDFKKFYLEAITLLENSNIRNDNVRICCDLIKNEYPENYIGSFFQNIKSIQL
jgi:glycosyltransferase involved in cell wall biosynthesis